jgi:hypothetical protein
MIFFLVLALFGFVASAVVHASTFLPAPPLGMDQTWPLHLGIFVVSVPGFLTQRRRGRTAATPDAKDPPQQLSRDDSSSASRWAYAVLAVVGCYAFVGFLVGMVRFPEKIVRGDDGRYGLLRDGAVVREAGETEYRRNEGRGIRMFSGLWMVFYAGAAVEIAGTRGRARARARQRRYTAGPLAACGGGYTIHPAPRLEVATHATLMVMLPFVVAIACAAAAMWLDFRPNAPRGLGAGYSIGDAGCLLAILTFLLGMCGTARWLSRYVGARCPSCGGRSLTRPRWLPGGNSDAFTYTCLDCGHASRPDGSEA